MLSHEKKTSRKPRVAIVYDRINTLNPKGAQGIYALL